MDFTEFASYVDSVEARHQALGLPEDMSLFERLVASDVEIGRVELELDLRLPEQYKEFMKRYGGGAFASLDLLPLVSRSGRGGDLLDFNQEEVSVSISSKMGDWSLSRQTFSPLPRSKGLGIE